MNVPKEVLSTIENAKATGQVDSFEYKKAVLDRFLWEQWGSFECELIYNKRIRLRDDNEVGISALYEEFKSILEGEDVSLDAKLADAIDRSGSVKANGREQSIELV